MLQCVAVCYSVLQSFSLLLLSFRVVKDSSNSSGILSPFTTRCVVKCCSVLQCVAVCCSVLQCVAVCCGAFQFVAVCCSVLQCDVVILLCTPSCGKQEKKYSMLQ